ncbi:MAG: hypothetical protein WAM91_00385 [Candidatus Acidiferrales bacterium]
MKRYLPATTILICAAMLAPAAARAQRGGGGHGGGGGHAGGGGSMHGSSMGGGSMHSSGSFGGSHGSSASRSFSPPRTTPQRAPYSPGRYPTASRPPMQTRPGFANASSRNIAPRSGAPTRPTYSRATANTVNRTAQNFNFRRREPGRGRFFGNPRFRGFNSFGPILFWGAPYLYDSCYYDYDYYGYDNCGYPYYDNYGQYAPGSPYADQPDQMPSDQDRYAQPPNDSGGGENAFREQPAGSSQPTPGPDEWVLVRKDGGLIFTSAFTVHSGQIAYINSAGILRKVMLADLDLDATHKFNDERGATISLPN